MTKTEAPLYGPRKLESIKIVGRRWFQRSNGNTYHTADIYVNGEHVHTIPFSYGYGDMYVQNATEWLVKNGYIVLRAYANGGYEPLWQARERIGFTLKYSSIDVTRKGDL